MMTDRLARALLPTLLILGMALPVALPVTAADPAPASAPEAASVAGPAAAAVPIDAKGQMHFSPTDRCPVCAMVPNAKAGFGCGLQVKGGKTWYFCGTGCMMKSWLHPEVFLKTTKSELSLAVVQEYFTGKHVDARSVTFVRGSDVLGPMGPAMVPVEDAQVDTFKRRHGGKGVFKLADLDDAMWESMTGKRVVPAP